jgi:transcription initiation factor TFIIIB Brf1 subunit/transcription initiation factor TFIIB
LTQCSICRGRIIENNQGALFCADCGAVITENPRAIKLLEYDKKKVTEKQNRLHNGVIPKQIIEKTPIRSQEYVYVAFTYRRSMFDPVDYLIVTEEKIVSVLKNKLRATPLENVVTINPLHALNNGQKFQIIIETFERKIIFDIDGVPRRNVPILEKETSEVLKSAQHALELKLKGELDYESVIWKVNLQLKTSASLLPAIPLLTAAPLLTVTPLITASSLLKINA